MVQILLETIPAHWPMRFDYLRSHRVKVETPPQCGLTPPKQWETGCATEAKRKHKPV